MIRQHDNGRRWLNAWVRAGLGCLPLALPMVLMIAWRSGDHVTGKTMDWFNWQAKLNWVLMVLRDRWMTFDIVSVTILFVILLKGVRDARIEYSRNLGLSALFLLAVFIVLPRIVFGSAYADMRLAPFVFAIALIALRPRPGLRLRDATTLAALGLAFTGVRLAATTASYWMYSNSYDRTLAALDHVPVGAKLVTFVGRRCVDDWTYSRLEHIPAIALERKLAYTNDQWSMAGAQLLTARFTAAGHFAHDPSQIVTGLRCRGEWWRPVALALARFPRQTFDYVWLIQPPAYRADLVRGLVPIWRDGTSVLFRVDHRMDAAMTGLPLPPEALPLPGQPLRRKGVSAPK